MPHLCAPHIPRLELDFSVFMLFKSECGSNMDDVLHLNNILTAVYSI